MIRVAAGRRPPTARRVGRWLTPPLLALAAGCTVQDGGSTADPAVPSPFADCAALAAPPALATRPPAPARSAAGTKSAARASAPRESGAASRSDGPPGAAMPDLSLPCFTGGQPFRLADLRGPALLNLWRTSCGPCREELPAVQRLAERSAGRLHVIGVDTGDSRDAAAEFGTDLKLTFPNLVDREGALPLAVGRPLLLPMTVFVDATGHRFVYNGRSLDDAGLTKMVREHTGVAVPW